MKKYQQIIKYALSSGSSFAIDAGMFLLFKTLLGAKLGVSADFVCTALARIISSFYNFNINNALVFNNKGGYGKALLKYYCLCIPQMIVSGALTTLADNLLGVSAPLLSTVVKICVDCVLFIASYFIQKKWVFRDKNRENDSLSEKN